MKIYYLWRVLQASIDGSKLNKFLDIGYNSFSFEYNRPAVTLKWIACLCTSTGSGCLEGRVRHRKSRLSLGTHTAVYSRLLSNALPIPVSFTGPIILRHTTSQWIKHAFFYLEIVIEEFQIMTHRSKRITRINLGTQNTGTYHQLPESRSVLVETRRLCLSLNWFSGINFPWEPGPLLCPWPWRLPV